VASVEGTTVEPSPHLVSDKKNRRPN
jgi:hypothetical protein